VRRGNTFSGLWHRLGDIHQFQGAAKGFSGGYALGLKE